MREEGRGKAVGSNGRAAMDVELTTQVANASTSVLYVAGRVNLADIWRN